ncbi:MAG: radical SAM protein [bacterium]
MFKLLLRPPFIGIICVMVANGAIRRAILKMGEREAYRGIVEENPWGRPRRVQEDKFYMVRNMLRAVDKLLGNGSIPLRVRRGLLGCLAGGAILGSGKGAAERFRREFGFDPPSFLTISPGKFCNLRCEGCYASSFSGASERLDYDVLDRIVAEKTELWGSHFTVISGGEPLLYRSRGKDIFDLAEEHRDNFFLVYTNGTVISEDVAERFAAVGNMTPAISVEGFERETDARRGKGTHGKILKAFENLRRFGVPYGISVTATRENAELVVSDEFVDYYLGELGAIYGWIFQYMPIGRGFTLNLLVAPEQRLAMFHRIQKLVRERGVFIADFWNSGTCSDGCISAGREGGYLYIDWNGDVMPCVFNPYAACNIVEIYKNGGNLNTALLSPFFEAIRRWERDYSLKQPPDRVGNMIRPCPIRDHHAVMRDLIDRFGARPTDGAAEEALKDADYYRGLVEYGEKIEELTSSVWEEEYLRPERAPKEPIGNCQ